jgi:hypothetical protein
MVKKLLNLFKSLFAVDHLEICSVCQMYTNVSKDTPIEDRQYYVQCAGQLCKKCYTDILKNWYD